MNKDKLIILGAGGHGRVVADAAALMGCWSDISFLDDTKGLDYRDTKIIGRFQDIDAYLNDYHIFIAIGNNTIREKLFHNMEKKGAAIPVIVHPGSIIGANVRLGAGTVVMAGTVINCNCNIGKGVIINTGATIDHDNYLEDFVHISPGAHTAGSVRIGKASWIGIGATVIDHIDITKECIIGAGAVVIRNIEEKGTYVGIPSRKIS